ncbi:MAG: ECF transporter S component [Oscillospiraceae bacterium]|nr:ECF transporter S component [Oscillospiraceae bacterium]
MSQNAVSAKSARIKKLVTLAMLTAVTYVVMLLCKSIPDVAGFLQLEVKDTVICIGGFLYGPVSAAVIAVVVAVIEMLTVSGTGPIGCLMNVLATAVFCCTASYIYKKNHSRHGAVIGLGVATLALTVVMILWNYLITPLYMGVPRAAVVEMLLPVFLPFNLVKGALNMAATLIIYKPVVTALRKANLVPPSHDVHAAPKKLNGGFWLFTIALLATAIVTALVLMGKI